MVDKLKEKTADRLLIKETTSIDEVNKMIRKGWTLLSAKFQFGTILFKLVKE